MTVISMNCNTMETIIVYLVSKSRKCSNKIFIEAWITSDETAARTPLIAAAACGCRLSDPRERKLFRGQLVGVRSDVFRITKSTAPLWLGEWFAPIIGHPHDFSVP
jgi:hypothetical protein